MSTEAKKNDDVDDETSSNGDGKDAAPPNGDGKDAAPPNGEGMDGDENHRRTTTYRNYVFEVVTKATRIVVDKPQQPRDGCIGCLFGISKENYETILAKGNSTINVFVILLISDFLTIVTSAVLIGVMSKASRPSWQLNYVLFLLICLQIISSSRTLFKIKWCEKSQKDISDSERRDEEHTQRNKFRAHYLTTKKIINVRRRMVGSDKVEEIERTETYKDDRNDEEMGLKADEVQPILKPGGEDTSFGGKWSMDKDTPQKFLLILCVHIVFLFPYVWFLVPSTREEDGKTYTVPMKLTIIVLLTFNMSIIVFKSYKYTKRMVRMLRKCIIDNAMEVVHNENENQIVEPSLTEPLVAQYRIAYDYDLYLMFSKRLTLMFYLNLIIFSFAFVVIVTIKYYLNRIGVLDQAFTTSCMIPLITTTYYVCQWNKAVDLVENTKCKEGKPLKTHLHVKILGYIIREEWFISIFLFLGSYLMKILEKRT